MALAACSPPPRRIVHAPAPTAPPRRVEAAAPPASSAPPPAAPEQPNPSEPGCAVAPATNTLAHDALAASGLSLTNLGSRAAIAWITPNDAIGFDPLAIEVDSNGHALNNALHAPSSHRVLTVEHATPYVGTDGEFHLAVDRRVRIDASEWVDCGAVRGEVAHFDDAGQYAEEGDTIHFDPASCATVVADDHPFVVWTYPEPDNDLFSGSVSVNAGPHPQAAVRQWTFQPARALFDLGMPWLRALASESPVDPVATVAPGGGYAIAWRQNGVVAMQWIRDDLAPRVAPRSISTPRAEAGPPQIASNAREAVVVYAERASARARSSVRAVRLVPPGNRRAPIAPTTITRGPNEAFAPSIAAVGNDTWAITWSERAPQSSDRVMLQLFDAALTPVGAPVVVAENATSSRVAHVGDNLVVAALSGDAVTRDVITRAARCLGRAVSSSSPPHR
jgi:hypothetical protein